jgi:N-ethylmaleimide reductase
VCRSTTSHDDNPAETYATLLKAIEPMKLAYLHVILLKTPQVDGLAVAKANFTGPMILNDSITLERGNEMVDMAAKRRRYRSPGISWVTPTSCGACAKGLELAPFDRKTLYTPGAAGYTDYPFINK